jgi:sugar/nucleoside kinase (ribokinase family)
MLCVTLGASGAMLLKGDEVFTEPAFSVEAVDTTGAGDVFRAALIDGLLKEREPREMLRFANAAAAASCTRAGAMASVPSRDEVQRLLSGG